MKSLRIVFMGTPDFAVGSLKALLETRHEVVAVVTSADKPAGRGRQVKQSAVKDFAISHALRIFQPERLRDETFLAELRSLHADLYVVVAFRMLPESVWNMPPLGTINVHASLLPDYRGAAPINHALIQGEVRTGVTTFLLNHEIDAGQILLQSVVDIGPDETAGELHDKLMIHGAKLLVETVDGLAEGTIRPEPQVVGVEGQKKPHPAPKIFKDDCQINWLSTAREVHNFVRGLSPSPAAWTMLGDQSLRIFSGSPENDVPGKAGTTDIRQPATLRFACADGWYRVNELQLEGKKKMGVEEFLRGRKSQPGT